MRKPASLFMSMVGLICPLFAQYDSDELLRRTNSHVRDMISRMSKYLCTQTIERTQLTRVSNTSVNSCDWWTGTQRMRPVHMDRLRIDVAPGKGGEMYSWPGANRFDDQGLLQLVREGSISTGSFSGFLTSLFTADGAEFSYEGVRLQGGRQLAEYAFRVPLERSHYLFGPALIQMPVAYEGMFLVHPETADIAQLVLRVKKPGIETGACEATTTIDYSRLRVNDSEFLMPTAALLDIVNRNGIESRNQTTISGCHEFLAESSVRFGAPDAGRPWPDADQQAAAAPLREGLRFRIAITNDIHTATAAAGDIIAARLTTAIQDESKKVLVPSGTALTARILGVDRDYEGIKLGNAASNRITIRLRLEALASGESSVPLVATAEEGQEVLHRGSFATVGCFHPRSCEPGVTEIMFEDAPPGFVIKAGLEFKWATARAQVPH